MITLLVVAAMIYNAYLIGRIAGHLLHIRNTKKIEAYTV